MQGGLWEKGALGLQTHVIPQRAFYGFNEAIIGHAEGTMAREPLAQAYDALAGHLFWVLDPEESSLNDLESSIFALTAKNVDSVARVERLLRHLLELARHVGSIQHEESAIRKLLDLGSIFLPGDALSDESALRKRLAEIEAQPKSAPPPRPKRRRPTKSS